MENQMEKTVDKEMDKTIDKKKRNDMDTGIT